MFNRYFFFLFAFASIIVNSQTRDSIPDFVQQLQDSTLNNPVDSLLFNFKEKINDTSLTAGLEKSNIINYQPHSTQSYFIGKTDILRNDYRYTGDFFKLSPFSFERSYGFIGQPNDIYLYGLSSSSYFVDGVPISNDRLFNFDFNQIQSEDIDSIEIVPLPRGFLYGFATNPVSVNFISKDIIPSKPYSRIKYYEGPFGEAFIDGIFSMKLFNDLIASVDITNRKVDDSFKNSAFSIWQVKTKLRYNLSDDINLLGSYYFSKSESGINGGVNIDEIRLTTQDVNSLLFNTTRAPVYFEKNSQNNKQHNFALKMFARPIENAFTELSFYYRFSLHEYSEDYLALNAKTTSKNKILGVVLDQKISFDPINLWLQTGYQSFTHTPFLTSSDSTDSGFLIDRSPAEYNSFIFAPLLSISVLDSMIVPSVYFKAMNILQKNTLSGNDSNEKLIGFGTDLSVYFIDHFNLYLGFSRFDDGYFIGEKNSTIEIRLNYIDGSNKLTASVFNNKTTLVNSWGAGFNVSYLFWKILVEGRISQYFIEESVIGNNNIPETSFNLGIYYKDHLFDFNLDLKTGIIFNYFGRQNLRDLHIPYFNIVSANVHAASTLDFTVSAEIQKSAIVYFTWENLLDKQYYITPYYPMLERNIRFGVAWEIFN